MPYLLSVPTPGEAEEDGLCPGVVFEDIPLEEIKTAGCHRDLLIEPSCSLGREGGGEVAAADRLTNLGQGASVSLPGQGDVASPLFKAWVLEDLTLGLAQPDQARQEERQSPSSSRGSCPGALPKDNEER